LGAGRKSQANRGYFLAALLGVVAAALVFWQLEWSESTRCFRRSVEIAIAGNEETLPGCDLDAFDAVRSHIREQRMLAMTGDFVPEEPEELTARSALIVWMALFAATAGFAAIMAVRSIFIVIELKPRWTATLFLRSLGAAMLVAFPFVLFRFLRFELSAFEDLHAPQILWIPPIIGLLMLPAVTGLVVVWHIISTQSELGLPDVARLGSRMRQLISMLGAVLALGIFATASRWQAIATLPGGEAVPSILVLLWGSIFALVLGALYVPVHQTWAAAADALVADEVERQFSDSKSRAGTPGFRAPELSIKKELHAPLGVGGAVKTLQGSLAVLAPVIAAAISSLFS
jgi:hypothetical protein